MAQGAVTQPGYVGLLTNALQKRLADVQVRSEQVRAERYRFIVVSAQFEGMGHPERQRLVWDVADAALAPEDVRNVAMIVTLAPCELDGE